MQAIKSPCPRLLRCFSCSAQTLFTYSNSGPLVLVRESWRRPLAWTAHSSGLWTAFLAVFNTPSSFKSLESALGYFWEGYISHLKFLPCHHCLNPPCWRVFWGLPVLQRFLELTRPTARELFVTVLWLFQDSNFSCSHWLLLTLFSLPSNRLFDQHCTMHVPVHSLS